MDLLIEKLVLKFGRNRSRNNEVMTILNIWWKKRRILFLALWTPNFRIVWISKTDLVLHDEGNRMAFTPSKSALRFLRSQGGSNRPPHQLTSSRKLTSNRVKVLPIRLYPWNKAVSFSLHGILGYKGHVLCVREFVVSYVREYRYLHPLW